jgi:uncharacterized protein YecT (DUF1311 family)
MSSPKNRRWFFTYCLFFTVSIWHQSYGEEACLGETPLKLAQCLENQYQIQDSILNTVYLHTISEIEAIFKTTPTRLNYAKTQLKNQQKNWIVSRDQHCLFVSQCAIVDTSSNGYQLHQSSLTLIACKTEYTKDRIKQLQEILQALSNR